MNKLSWHQVLVIVAVIVYLGLLLFFGYGLFVSVEITYGIFPSEQDIAFFGVGLCSFPFLLLASSIVPFACTVYKEFNSYSVKEAPAAAPERQDEI